MIQRIQSVYLLLGIIAVALMFVFPFVTLIAYDLTASLKGFALNVNPPNSGFSYSLSFLPGAIATLLALLLIITLLQFKNRKLQIKLLLFSMLSNLALIGSIFFVVSQIQKIDNYDIVSEYQVGTYLSLVVLIFIVLANRGIRKDEAKVRAADRLR